MLRDKKVVGVFVRFRAPPEHPKRFYMVLNNPLLACKKVIVNQNQNHGF
jgi:hypothetical protein